MSRCRYNLSEECHNKDCVMCNLEKIKAEFEEDKYILLNQTVAIQIIDRRIAELEGEQDNE